MGTPKKHSTAKIEQTANDLRKHLKEQCEFLARSAKAFDEGSTSEGKRLAISIRVLVHDTTSSVSLVKQVGRKETMGFYDTSIDYNPRNLAPVSGLVMMGLGPKGGGWIAPLDKLSAPRLRPKVLFDQWWNKIVFPIDRETLLTRKDLVLAVAHKDGGAHVDPHLDKRYAEISRYDSMGWKFYVNGVEQDFRNPILVSLRQIAHEMMKSLKDEFPDLFDDWPT